ncbi:MAG: hypothetical protein AAGB48_04240 [Planctomycetota bacterium]
MPIDPTEKPVRDKKGRVFCRACAKQLMQEKATRSSQGGKVALQAPNTQAAVVSQPQTMMAALIDEGLKRVAVTCPNCANCVPEETVICTRCGYNFRSCKLTGTQIVKAPKEKGASGPSADQMPQFAALGVFGGITGLGIGAYFVEALALPFLIIYAITSVILGGWCLVAAFRQSVTTGLAYMFVPFYGLYWLFKRCESETLRNCTLAFIAAYFLVLAFTIAGVGTSPFTGLDSIEGELTEAATVSYDPDPREG